MNKAPLRVLMMPDYRAGNPYQQLLADAIEKTGIEVVFPRGYRRVLPIYRAVRDQQPVVQVLHLHWLEPYFNQKHPFLEFIYGLKFLIDLALTRLTGIRVVWTVHNQIEHDSHCPGFERWLRRLVMTLSDRIIVHNRLALDALTQEYTLNPAKVTVIPHGHYRTIYSAPIEQTEARKQLNLPLEGLLYLHLGALRPYKGIEHLLEVWQANRTTLGNATLLIAGCSYDSEYQDKLGALIAQTSGTVYQPGFISEEQIHLFFSAADIVVLPYTRILTSGSVLLAMSFGKPVIAPRLGAIPEVLGKADWLLYDASDPQGLSHALQKSQTCCLPDLGQLTAQACDGLDWETIGQKTAWAIQQCFPAAEKA